MKEVANFEHCVQTAVTNMAKQRMGGDGAGGGGAGGGGGGNENVQCSVA